MAQVRRLRSVPAKAKSRAEQVAALPENYLLCRAIGSHQYECKIGYGVTDSHNVVQVNWGYMRLVCTNCGMEVERQFDPFFELMHTKRTEPKGYGVRGAGRGNWRQEAREALFTRQVGAPPFRNRRGRRSKSAG